MPVKHAADKSRRRRCGGLAVLVAAILLTHTQLARSAAIAAGGETPGTLCADAIHDAEITYGLPPGLLAAVGEVESGRIDAATGRLEPWPWTAQSAGQSWYFATKRQAVQWTREAMARGLTSIDTGCLQVNLFYHPRAFGTLDAAFEPRSNVDYAARFLSQLYGATGDWRQATGFYHSQTRALAASYELLVQHRLGRPSLLWPRAPEPSTKLARLASSWQATLPPAGLPSSPAGNSWSTLLRPAPDAVAGRPRVHSRRMAAGTAARTFIAY